MHTPRPPSLPFQTAAESKVLKRELGEEESEDELADLFDRDDSSFVDSDDDEELAQLFSKAESFDDEGDEEDKKVARWSILLRWLKSTPGSGSMISELFADLDLDGSGTVDIHEFLGGLQKIGLDGMSDNQLKALHGDCDLDGDGQLTLEEFTTAIAEFYKTHDPEQFESAVTVTLHADEEAPADTKPAKDKKQRRVQTMNDVGGAMNGGEINPDFVHNNQRGQSTDDTRMSRWVGGWVGGSTQGGVDGLLLPMPSTASTCAWHA